MELSENGTMRGKVLWYDVVKNVNTQKRRLYKLWIQMNGGYIHKRLKSVRMEATIVVQIR